jgi:drug/metabolite transporter (DMT)-like permease
MFKQLSSEKKAIFALSVLVLIWGYNWVVMKIAVRYAPPFQFAALRVSMGGVILFLLLLCLRKPLRPREISGTFITGLLQTSGFYALSTWALVSGGAGKTAVLNYAMPFWVLLLAWFVLGEQVRKLQWLGVVFALTGLIFILMPFRLSEGLFSKELALLSSISWAVGIIVAKRLQQKTTLDLFSFTTWQMLFGSIPLILCALLVPSRPTAWSTPYLTALAYSAVLGGAVAWLLWFYALSHLPAGIAGLGTLATPVVGVLAAWIQIGEIPSGLEILGILLIFSALILNSMQALKVRSKS